MNDKLFMLTAGSGRPLAGGLRCWLVHYVLQHWSFDPFLILVAVVVAWHEIGLRRLARRSRPDRTRQRRIRSLWFYSGLAVLLIAVESPIDYWADDYFFVHMIQHLLLMFAAPSLVVAGAPWQPLLDGLPGRSGQAATRGVMTGGWSRPLRAVGGFFLRPWPAIVTFNVVMVGWHIPVLFDLAEDNGYVHIWLMHSSFFAAGVAPVHSVTAVPEPVGAAGPGGGAARDERRHDLHRDGAVHLRDEIRLRAV
jgi:cytochrome c oxidase assembly factor CtaG